MWWDRLKAASAHLTTAAAVLGLVYGVGKPHAEEFVREAVRTNLEKLERRIDAVQDRQQEQITAQTRIESDISSMKGLQKESRDDIKTILRSLRAQ